MNHLTLLQTKFNKKKFFNFNKQRESLRNKIRFAVGGSSFYLYSHYF